MKKTLRRTLGAAALLAVSACVASASMISYSVDVFGLSTTAVLCPGGVCPAGSTATLGTGGGPNVSLTIPQFNQLGNADEGTPSAQHIFALTSVALTLDWKATGSVTTYNFYSSNLTFTNAQASTLMTLTAGGTQVVANGAAATGAGTALCCNVLNGIPLYLGSTTFNNLSGAGSNSQNAANLSFFQGLGASTFLANLATDAVTASGSSLDPHANASTLAYSGSGQMGAIMSITYNYTEQYVPEPGTMALMGSSLIGLAVLIRRRTANR